VRRQLAGIDAIEAALAGGVPVRLLLLASGSADPRVKALAERAQRAGIPVHPASERALWRLSKESPAARALALVGPAPDAGETEVLRAGGAAWLLVGTAYPGNTGFAIRTAEVSGADGIFIDNEFDHEGKREATRAAMRADRFMPVFWRAAAPVLTGARAAGRRIFAIEDVGTAAPWEVDLTQPALLIIGGEHAGIPGAVLDRADEVIRIPMAGFIPSYNLQAAMAAVALERLRQLTQV
jgi:23S rRNA (guanosine2251-2'-O)-methyltransferase